MSPELSEYRVYRQGDDPRQLDWKLLARTDRAFVRLAEERSILSTMFVLDASASMAFPSHGTSKWDYAVGVAIALAAVARGVGDPVGLIVPTISGEAVIAPHARRGIVREMARALGSVTPRGSPEIAPVLRRGLRAGRIAIVSDFLGDQQATRVAAQALVAQGRDVHAVHVIAEEELEPVQGAAMVVDPEQPSLRRPMTAATRSGYRDRFAQWREDLGRSWRLTGATFTEVIVGEPTARAVVRVVAA